MTEKCCKCGALIFETTFGDDKGKSDNEDNFFEIHPKENDKLIVCISCSRKSDSLCKKD
jgi:hypothetical protein